MADERRGEEERPDYKVYKSRPGLFSRLRSPDLSKVREKKGRKDAGGDGEEKPPRSPVTALPLWRRVLRWTGIFALVWIAISFLAFEISSQIQKSKLVDMGNTLHGNPFLAVSPQNILVIGTDIRSGQFSGPNEAASKSCLDAAGSGKAPPSKCTPYRSDTLMLIRAGGGDFRKFIDSVGGVDVNVPRDICSNVSGTFSLQLKKGDHTLNGAQAITLARTRENNLAANPPTG